MNVKIITFYEFVAIDELAELREALLAVCKGNQINGTILLAHEGINGTIAGSEHGIDTTLDWLRSDPRCADLEVKVSYADEVPFYRMKVKLKREIVTFKQESADPTAAVGAYIDPSEWNNLISNPDVTLIDTRNQFEVSVGTFTGAIDPQTTSFSEFADYVRDNLDPNRHKKVAMFCTGGIRCEKATSYLLQHGFDEVYHLKGGILNYLAQVPVEQSQWQGECFVFDNRVTVDHNLAPGNYAMCHNCRYPLDADDLASPHYEEGVSCPHCYERLTVEREENLRERQKQVQLAEARGEAHIGRKF